MSKAKRKRKFKPTFRNGGFWEHYRDLERQFQEFLNFVPYFDNNKGVHSFRLTNILLNLGGYVDSAFKEMARYPEFCRRKDSNCKKIVDVVRENRKKIKRGEFAGGPGIKFCLETFEEIYHLSQRKVNFKRLPLREEVFPYFPFNQETNAPYWWDVYNHTKHDFHEFFEKTNLESTRNALAGAFLLNVIHKPSILRLNEHNVTKPKYGINRVKSYVLRDILKTTIYPPLIVETELFYFDCEKEG